MKKFQDTFESKTENSALVSATLVLMAGLPGTGKTKLAYQLVKSFGGIVIDKDIIHTAMLSKGLNHADSASAAYEVAFCLVKDLLLNQGQSVILDTAGRQPFILERARIIAKETQGTLKIIRCVAPHEVRVARLAGRISLDSQWASNQATDTAQE